MVTFSTRPSLTQLLLQPDLIEQLRDRFRFIQENHTTTIHEAADLAQLTEAQLRYAETRGLLSPNRAVNDSNAEEIRSRGQRRYTVDDLFRAHLISFLLYHGYSLTEISTFMKNNTSIIDELLETTTLRLNPVLDSADTTMFNRFFIPRALYYALTLIFERDTITDAGIIFPVRGSSEALVQINPGEIHVADDLMRLGHMCVAWRARGRPLATFITVGNPFEREQRVSLKSLAAINGEPIGCSRRDHIYVAFEPQMEAELEQARAMFAQRKRRFENGDSGGQAPANPRTVACQLIHYTQQLYSSDAAAMWKSDMSMNGTLFYNAPAMVNPLLGDALLNRLADTIVELGGDKKPDKRSPQESEEPTTAQPAKNWRFCCVMSPKEYNAPLNQQQLVVRAQSKEAPHRIGVTTTSAQLNGGLTFRAFSSGHIVYRPYVDQLDPAISYAEQEAPIKSAIALPAVEGERQYHSKPSAVIYVASEWVDSFKPNDFLMIRVLARLVGEIVQTYNSRGLNLNTLTDALADPIIIDSFFADFLSDTSFTSDLSLMLLNLISPKPPEQPKKSESSVAPDHADHADHAESVEHVENVEEFHRNVERLTLIGLDINGFSDLQRGRGEQIGRIITRDIGRRIQKRMKSSFTRGIVNARIYRMWGDRFYLLVRDEDSCKAQERADHIRREVNGLYELDPEVTTIRPMKGQPASQVKGGIEISIRMAGVEFSRDDLLGQLQQNGATDPEKITDIQRNRVVASLSHLLQDGLEQANDISDMRERAVWWDARSNRFEQIISAAGAGEAPLE